MQTCQPGKTSGEAMPSGAAGPEMEKVSQIMAVFEYLQCLFLEY